MVRGEDGSVRAFHNVCRHRAARLVDGPSGHCGRPHHLPLPRLELRPRRAPGRRAAAQEVFKGLDTTRHGLAPLEHEVFLGFVFVRFAPGLPSVREMAAPYLHELAPYRLEELHAAWAA